MYLPGLWVTTYRQWFPGKLRTIRGWELEGRYPKKRELYAKIAEILGCEVSYLLTEEEDFITGASELYGSRGAKQAEQILEQTAAAAGADAGSGTIQYDR